MWLAMYLIGLVCRVLAALKSTAAGFGPRAVKWLKEGKSLCFERKNCSSSRAMSYGWLEAAGTFMLVSVWPAYVIWRAGCKWYALLPVLICAVIFAASLPVPWQVRGAGAAGTLYLLRMVFALDLRGCAVLFFLAMCKMSSWVHGLGLQILFKECEIFTLLCPQTLCEDTENCFNILKTNPISTWKECVDTSYYFRMFQLCIAEDKQNRQSVARDKMLLFRHMFMPLMTCRAGLMVFIFVCEQFFCRIGLPLIIAMLDLTPIDWKSMMAAVAGAFAQERVWTEEEMQDLREYARML